MRCALLRSVRPAVLLTAALVFLATGSSLAQSTLADETCVVFTGQGLFFIEKGQPAIKVFDQTPFGGNAIEGPSVTWINGSNSFILTRRDLTGKGGVWRVDLAPDGSGTLHDLLPSIPAGTSHDFVDADYSVGLDTLFLLERQSGHVLANLHPAAGSGTGFLHWASLTPDTGVSIAVRGAKHPFTVLVVTATGEVMQVDKHGTKFLNKANNPSWSGITTHPLDGRYFLCSDSQDKVVVGMPDFPSGIPQAYISMNTYDFAGPCGPLAGFPLDIVCDPRTSRVIALAGDFVPACAFGGVATGKGHIMRLPFVASGPPGSEPVLLTAPGDSGVLGSHGDLAYVRHGTADITWYGASGSGAGTSVPLFTDNGPQGALFIGDTAKMGLEGAPPLTAALLVLGLSPLNVPLQGQLFGPYPHAALPAITDVAGVAEIVLAVPPVSALVGLHVYLQWWIDDTTTAPAGDLASSQVGIFTIGTL